MSILLLSYVNKNKIKGDHQISEKMEDSKIWVMLTLKNVQLQISTMADLTLEPGRFKNYYRIIGPINSSSSQIPSNIFRSPIVQERSFFYEVILWFFLLHWSGYLHSIFGREYEVSVVLKRKDWKPAHAVNGHTGGSYKS